MELLRLLGFVMILLRQAIGLSLLDHFSVSACSRRQACLSIVSGATTAVVTIGSFPTVALAAPEDSAATTTLTGTDEEEERRRQEELLQRIRERRQLMEASRSSNSRQSYLDLSRQRAALYNTTSKAVSCPPNVPCY